jgi:outer membrane receptor protein involved in Fe transport
MSTAAEVKAAVRRTTHISAQGLGPALQELAKDHGFQVLYRTEVVGDARTVGAAGELTATEALTQLLSGTGLTFRYLDDATVMLVSERDASADEPASPPAGGPQASQTKVVELDEVVVTGSRIRGAQNSPSPLVTFEREDIARTGLGSTEDFMRTVPQIFAGGASGTTIAGLFGGEGASNNLGFGTGLNLRGLGTKSTLVLLDGNRLAPGGTGEVVDISVIPLAALERIDVLTDGASAIYGADAVGGVVNFITRKNFDGNETRLRYGVATEGSPDNYQVSHTVGRHWNSGNVMLSADFAESSALETSDRDFTSATPPPTELLPAQSRRSALLSVNQRLGESFELYGSALASQRESRQNLNFGGYVYDFDVASRTLAGTAGLRMALSGTWRADFSTSYGGSRTHFHSFIRPPYSITTDFLGHAASSVADAKVDGAWFDLPGGEARLALNGQFRHESYKTVGGVRATDETLTRNVGAGSFELLMPFISQRNARPGIAALEATVAARYERYSDFGSSANPKIGLLWMPVPGFNVRGTYGTSFRAPLLSELDEDSYRIVQTLRLADPTAAGGFTDTIYLLGNNAALSPEEARNWTVGVDFADPHSLGVSGSVTYFRVDFKDRIAAPIPNSLLRSVLSREATYGATIHRNPDLADVIALFNTPGFFNFDELTPADVGAIVDNRLHNTTRRKVDGIDVSLAWRGELAGGSIASSISGTRLLNLSDQATPGSPSTELLNTVYYPAQLRLRASLSWQRNMWDIGTSADFTDGYRDVRTEAPYAGPMPRATVGSWTTVNLNVAYRVPEAVAGLWSGTRVSLSVQNILDRDPPYVAGVMGLNFDPTNATAMGRYAAIEVSKQW